MNKISQNKVKKGQLWSLKGSESSEYKFASIFKVEALKHNDVVHISVCGSDMEILIEHMPFSKAAFLKSVESLSSINANIPIELDGYNYWKREYEAGNAGVYSIAVMDAVSL